MVLNAVGMVGEVVVLGWLTLELTNSPFLVGVAMGMRGLPMFFVGVPAGVLADRFPRHRLLMATGALQAVTTATLGVLTLTGLVTLTHVLLLTLAGGAMRGIEHSARQSYTHDVVGPTELMHGFAILGVGTRAGWLLGSLGTGAVIAHFGSGLAYLAVGASYLAGSAALLSASAPAGTTPPAAGSLWQSIVDFVTAMRKDPVLPALMLLTASAEILGFAHQALFPSLARDVLGVGPEGLGAPLVGFMGVIVILIVANAAGALADLLAQSLMQLSVPAHLRGRAGGAWVVAIGLGPLGHLQIGALASLFGVAVALGTSGAALVTLALAGALLFPRVRRL